MRVLTRGAMPCPQTEAARGVRRGPLVEARVRFPYPRGAAAGSVWLPMRMA